MGKVCKICLEIKDENEFYYRKDTKKYRRVCKKCFNAKKQKSSDKKLCIVCEKILDLDCFYNGNICKKCIITRSKRRYEEKKEKILEYKKEYYKLNKVDLKNKNKMRYALNRNKYIKNIRENRNRRRKEEPVFRMKENISKRINECLQGEKNNKPTLKMLGFSLIELKEHIERQFNKNMEWENYGSCWNLDHIIPTSIYNFSNKNEITKCWNINNLRPLETSENLKKSNNIDKELIMENNITFLLPEGVKI